MTKVLPRYCPRCGVPIVTSSGTCATCGLALESILSRDQDEPPEQMHHDQESLPENDQQSFQDRDELDVQQDNELDKVPTVQLGQQSNSRLSTQSLPQKSKQDSPHALPPKKRKM